MKYKKYSYILVLILMLLVGMNGVEALQEKQCYYQSNDNTFRMRLQVVYDAKNGEVNSQMQIAHVEVDMYDGEYKFEKEYVSNWFPKKLYGYILNPLDASDDCIADDSVCFGYRYPDKKTALNDKVNSGGPTCPNYIVLQQSIWDWVFVTDSETLAKQAQTNLRAAGKGGYYGKSVPEDEYWAPFVEDDLIKYNCDENCEPNDPKCESCSPTCSEDYEEIFGDPKDDGKTYDPDKDKQPSIRYMVNEILNYVRIFVPILIILLGTLDFAKAVLAGKEDGMRKAQSDFVKRLLIGVAVFFVPTIVDIIMSLADIVWAGQYSSCPL